MRIVPGKIQMASWRAYRFFSGTFAFNGKPLRYFCHPYNTAHLYERTIEIPLALEYVRGKESVLEIGNVLNRYVPFPHDVIDKFEQWPGVINADVRTFQNGRKYDVILSVSTLEHVGVDEGERPEAFCDAMRNLTTMLKPDGLIVATIPIGQNAWLDDGLRTGRLPYSRIYGFRRVNIWNAWKQFPFQQIARDRYGYPYGFGNAVALMEFHTD